MAIRLIRRVFLFDNTFVCYDYVLILCGLFLHNAFVLMLVLMG